MCMGAATVALILTLAAVLHQNSVKCDSPALPNALCGRMIIGLSQQASSGPWLFQQPQLGQCIAIDRCNNTHGSNDQSRNASAFDAMHEAKKRCLNNTIWTCMSIAVQSATCCFINNVSVHWLRGAVHRCTQVYMHAPRAAIPAVLHHACLYSHFESLVPTASAWQMTLPTPGLDTNTPFRLIVSQYTSCTSSSL